MLRRIPLAAASGLLLALAFEPYAIAWLIPFAVAGLLLSTRGLRPRSALLPGFVFGVGFYFPLTVWMSAAVGTDAWLGMSTAMALFYAALGAASAVLQRRRLWPVWCAAAWVTIEIWRSSWPFSGMPWGNLSFGVVDTPAAAALPYVGASGVSFLLALLGALVAALVVREQPRGRGRTLLATAAVAALLCGPALVPWSPEETGRATLAVVQGNVPGDGSDILLDSDQVTRNHVEATVDLAARVEAGEVPEPDLVVWPENSTATDPFADRLTNEGILAASEAIGVPLLVGAIVDGGPDHVLNQGIVWDPVTGAGERYTKRHPVVFGEYIPFRDYLDNLQIGRLTMVGRDMLEGTRREPLDVDGLLVGDAICFDVAYDDVFYDQVSRGAEVLTVQTSNATFINTDQIEQQFAITRLRARETGRWLAVASPNGISGVIDPRGEVVAQADPRTTEVLVEEVGLVQAVTPAVRLGAWPGRVFIVASLLGLLIGRLPYRRMPQDAGSPSDQRTAGLTPTPVP